MMSARRGDEEGAYPRTSTPSREGKLLARTEPVLEVLRTAIAPLLDKSSLLRPQAVTELFEAYGASLRFEAAYELIRGGELDLRQRPTKERVLEKTLEWVEREGGGPLRDWLREEFTRERPAEITAARPQILTMWLKGLELRGPVAPEERATVLAQLRKLWIAYPKLDHARLIRETAERIGISRDFKAPTLPDMTVEELLLKTQAHVRDIDGILARKTIQRVLELPAITLSRDRHWEALQLHIRVLRILDQRPLIPPILRAYTERGRFLKYVPGEEAREFYGRILDIARHTWTYDDSAKASALLDILLEKSPKDRPRTPDGQFAMALYIRARIAEQAGKVPEAIAAIDRALEVKKALPQENAADLAFRRFLLYFDQAQKGARSPAETLDALETTKSQNLTAFDRSRYHFWAARVAELAKKGEETKNQFRLAYRADPNSFYSNLAGLELLRLKDKPKDWEIGFDGEISRPEIEALVEKASGRKIYSALARVWQFARVADKAGVSRALPELGREAADEIANAKLSSRERRQISRAVVWLRRAVGDAYGSLRTAEVARTSLGSDFGPEDFASLYPLPYWPSIQAEAATNGIDPWLVASLIRQESAFDPEARSPANALGLMQMIPPVAQAEAKSLGLEDFHPEHLYEPATALRLGTYHLGGLVKGFDSSWISSIASYNAGRPPVLKWLGYYKDGDALAFVERISYQETRNYVRSILRNYINYQRIYGKGDLAVSNLVRLPAPPKEAPQEPFVTR